MQRPLRCCEEVTAMYFTDELCKSYLTVDPVDAKKDVPLEAPQNAEVIP